MFPLSIAGNERGEQYTNGIESRANPTLLEITDKILKGFMVVTPFTFPWLVLLKDGLDPYNELIKNANYHCTLNTKHTISRAHHQLCVMTHPPTCEMVQDWPPKLRNCKFKTSENQAQMLSNNFTSTWISRVKYTISFHKAYTRMPKS